MHVCLYISVAPVCITVDFEGFLCNKQTDDDDDDDVMAVSLLSQSAFFIQFNSAIMSQE